MEERKEECRGEREEKGCEGLGETLLGNGAVCVEDAEEETFPDLQEFDGCEGTAGAEVGL